MKHLFSKCLLRSYHVPSACQLVLGMQKGQIVSNEGKRQAGRGGCVIGLPAGAPGGSSLSTWVG